MLSSIDPDANSIEQMHYLISTWLSYHLDTVLRSSYIRLKNDLLDTKIKLKVNNDVKNKKSIIIHQKNRDEKENL